MMDKTNVEKVYDRSEMHSVPTLLKFQNGKLEAFSKHQTQFVQVEDNETKTKSALVVTNGNIYTGLINNNSADDLVDTYVCIRNKTSNKVRIIPIDQALLSNNIYNELDKVKQFKPMSEEVLQNTLLKQFGGKRASRYVSNREQMKVNVDVVRDNLDSTLNESIISVEEAGSSDDINYLETISPKCNKEAIKLADVYNVDDLVSTELMLRLEEEAKTVYSTPLDNIPIKSDYLKDCIKKIQSNKTPTTQDFHKLKLIIYMDALLSLINMRARNMHSAELSCITEKVEKDIRERFSDPNCNKIGLRTMYSNEKALTYFIVLALLISNDYQLDINLLSGALKCSRKKILTYAHVVNARLKVRSDVLSLRLPSTIPPITNNRRSYKAPRNV